MFVFAIGLLLILTLALLLLPLWRSATTVIPVGHEAAIDQERIDLEIERQTLLNSMRELDLDLEQGKFEQRDHERLKAVDERRLLNILNRLEELSNQKPDKDPVSDKKDQTLSDSFKWANSMVLSLVLVSGAIGSYNFVQYSDEQKRVAAAQPEQSMVPPNPAEMVARLEKRLKENPDDLEGQLMAGRSYTTLQRTDDAKKAWMKVLELNSRHYEANFNLGVILLQTDPRNDPGTLENVLEHFNIAEVSIPRDPILQWYKGLTLVYLKRFREADESWTTAFQNLSRGSEDAKMVQNALENLRAGNPLN